MSKSELFRKAVQTTGKPPVKIGDSIKHTRPFGHNGFVELTWGVITEFHDDFCFVKPTRFRVEHPKWPENGRDLPHTSLEVFKTDQCVKEP